MDDIILEKKYNEPMYKYNIYSVVLFMLDKPYKSTMTYYNGLMNALNNFRRVFGEKWFLRIYYDDSIITPKHKNNKLNTEINNYWIPIFKKIADYDFVQLIRYKHPKFMIDDIHHAGLFGTFVRMIPMFDYDFDGNNLNIIHVSDIDIMIKEIFDVKKKIFDKLDKSDYDFHFRSRKCQWLLKRFEPLRGNVSTEFRPLAGAMTTKIRFPKEWLNEFLDNIYEEKNHKIFKIIDDFGKLDTSTDSKAFGTSKLNYGIDEIFTSLLIDKILAHGHKVVCNLNPGLAVPFFAIAEKTDGYKKFNNDKNMNKLFRILLGKYYINGLNVGELYDILDGILYNKIVDRYFNIGHIANTEIIEKYFYVAKRIIRVSKFLLENNIYERYHFDIDDIKCLAGHKTYKLLDYVDIQDT